MDTQSRSGRTGIWVVGAHGDIAATMMVGTLAMRRNMTGTTGLVSEMPPMNGLALTPLERVVFGGIDIDSKPLVQAAHHLYAGSRTISREILDAVSDDLQIIDADILVDPAFHWRPAAPRSVDTPALTELLEKLRNHIRVFRRRHRLDRVVAVNLASSEPLPCNDACHESLPAFETSLQADRRDQITPSMLCAYAAFLEDCPHVNFTPNCGATPQALQDLARQRGLPFYGDDGKTGETLIKTALGPMFACRNLQVMSWEGSNMLGNNDGRTLADPENRAAKMRNKEGVLEKVLGYPVHSGVEINYVPSLGDWKTAWDLIHFRGFLDVPMTMQFTWQGCDSVLAAPLVLDLARFADFAAANGESGPMTHLACFFKNPIGVEDMALYPQFEALVHYAETHRKRQLARSNGTR